MKTKSSATAEMLLGQIAEEYFNQLAGGEEPDVEDYAARYAEFADHIREIFPALKLIKETTSSATQSPGTGIELTELNRLGDYQILGELGRGGMGVVYEAHQISLNRPVALKVLPFGAVMDSKQLARFKNEALAAASLDHPNIVDVFTVGCERSVHFYAMRYIEGQSVAQLIVALRQLSREGVPDVEAEPRSISQLVRDLSHGRIGAMAGSPSAGVNRTIDSAPNGSPAAVPSGDSQPQLPAGISTQRSGSGRGDFYRNVASLGVQAASALDHAHAHGVLHRDIKPGNLMVDTDGKLWVTDFGLARIESEIGMTLTGDLLGTLRYMSPEQALAKRAVVDHRTDIYSLGATLYELLALHPAHEGQDREEVLHQIANEAPRRLRQFDSRIPADLETIVDKAMRKSAEERYATAREFADDLKRLLNNEPIHAKRPTISQRISKWSQRHRSAVWAGAVMVVMLIISLTMGNVVISRAHKREIELRKTAQHQREEADRQRMEADRLRIETVQQRDASDQSLYRAHMRLAHQDWNSSHVARMHALLDAHRPLPDRIDQRGWEWYYLFALCQQDQLTLHGHTDSVNSVAWSPHGKWLASASQDNTIRLWDAKSGKNFLTCEIHCAGMAVEWRPDAQRVASSCSHGTVIVWEPHTGKRVVTFRGGSAISWSPNGKRIAAVDHNRVTVSDAATGMALQTLQGPADHVYTDVEWSPDGRMVACPLIVSKDVAIDVWDVAESKIVDSLDGHSRSWAATAVSWNPNGSRLASAGDDQKCVVWDTANWHALFTLRGHSGRLRHVRWSADGRRLATGSEDGSVKVWDAVTGKEQVTLRGHSSAVFSVAWSPDGRQLASSSGDCTIKVWEPATVQNSRQLSLRNHEPWIAWSPDGGQFAAVTDDTVGIYDAATGKKQRSLRGTDVWGGEHIGWSADGRRIVAVDPNGAVHIWDSQTQEVVSAFDIGYWIRVSSFGLCPDGSLLVVAGDDGVTVWNATTGDLVRSRRFSFTPSAMAVSPDGRQLALGLYGGELYIVEPETLQESVVLPRQSSLTRTICWSPEGRYLATGDEAGVIRLFDSTTGLEALAFPAHTSTVYGLDWSTDGRRLASGGADHAVKIWDAEYGKELLCLQGHDAWVWCVRWSPDGRRLISAGGDLVLNIWDAAPGYEFFDSAADRHHRGD